jgi:hypothetical protein
MRPILGKGTNRRIAQISWKRWETVHAVILSLLFSASAYGSPSGP